MVPRLLLLLLLAFHVHSGSGIIVKSLPGFEGPLPFELETGYVGVGEEEQVQLFYYFIKSERDPEQDPLLIWLSGGPGCSSITGLFFQNGPVAFKSEGYNGGCPTLVSTTYSWTKVANIIFLDQPVGTGFSYAKTQLLDTPSDTGSAKHLHEFLRKWLSKNTQFLSNSFYFAGDSYAGNIIPAAVQEISKGNSIGLKPHINLQGYVLGNPMTELDIGDNYRIPFAHGMAFISDELYQSLTTHCRGNYKNVDPKNTECLKAVEQYDKCLSGINFPYVLAPLCYITPPEILSPKHIPIRYLGEILLSYSSVSPTDCIDYDDFITSPWTNDERVREALHVVKGSIGKWIRCSKGKPYKSDIQNSVPYHVNNSLEGYRSLIYSGDHDLSVPFIGTQAWIRSLNYSIVDYWRPWKVDNQIAGYTQAYANNMTFATVKGGGHTAEYKPMESFTLFQRWISGQPI